MTTDALRKLFHVFATMAHRLIEEAMLAANVCSADFIPQSKHPGLFRVHEGPTPEKRDSAQLPEGHWPRV
jgi:exoribonuclease R